MQHTNKKSKDLHPSQTTSPFYSFPSPVQNTHREFWKDFSAVMIMTDYDNIMLHVVSWWKITLKQLIQTNYQPDKIEQQGVNYKWNLIKLLWFNWFIFLLCGHHVKIVTSFQIYYICYICLSVYFKQTKAWHSSQCVIR